MKSCFVIIDLELDIPLAVCEKEEKAVEWLKDYTQYDNIKSCKLISDKTEYYDEFERRSIRTITVCDDILEEPMLTTFKIIETNYFAINDKIK